MNQIIKFNCSSKKLNNFNSCPSKKLNNFNSCPSKKLNNFNSCPSKKLNNFNISNDNKKKNKKIHNYCNNCGKYGHAFKKCKEPITSYGLICFRLKNNILSDQKQINNDNIEYLLIQRKYTLGYTEFIRGKFFISDIYSIIILFKQMIQSEIDSIMKYDFDYHWNQLWLNKKSNNFDYIQSLKKFKYLKENKNNNNYLVYILKKYKPIYNIIEWGIPKGRPNNYEENILCAKREFEEETLYKTHEYKILNNINNYDKYIEIFNGTNGIKYQHIYYLTKCITDRNPISDFYSNEIGDIKWVSFNEIHKYIRPYHVEKISIFKDINTDIINNYII